MGTAPMLDFLALGRMWQRGISGNIEKFKGDIVLDHLKSKKRLQWGVHLGCFWLPYYKFYNFLPTVPFSVKFVEATSRKEAGCTEELIEV